MVAAICNPTGIILIPHNRIHLFKNPGKSFLTRPIQCVGGNALKALLIDIHGKNVLPVAYQKRICGGGHTPCGIGYICKQFLHLVFRLDLIHDICKIIGKGQLIIILKTVQIKLLAGMKIGGIINRGSLDCLDIFRSHGRRRCGRKIDGRLHLGQQLVIGNRCLLLICKAVVGRPKLLYLFDLPFAEFFLEGLINGFDKGLYFLLALLR